VPARENQTLNQGDRIKTGSGVARIAYLLTADVQEVRENTIIELKTVERLGTEGADRDRHGVRRDVHELHDGTGSAIEAPARCASSRRATSSSSRARRLGEDARAATHGGSRVTAAGETATLAARARRGGKEGLGEVRPTCPGRSSSSPSTAACTVRGPGRERTPLEWRVVPGAREHVLEIGRNDVFRPC